MERFREVADSLLMGWEWGGEGGKEQYLEVPFRPWGPFSLSDSGAKLPSMALTGGHGLWSDPCA